MSKSANGKKNYNSVVREQFHKTKMCPFFLKGHCNHGGNCTYAHNKSELKVMPDLVNTKLCDSVARGGMCKRPDCTYAHSHKDLRSSNELLAYKTAKCFFYNQSRCLNGANCRFAHGEEEIREYTDESKLLKNKIQNPNGQEMIDLGVTTHESLCGKERVDVHVEVNQNASVYSDDDNNFIFPSYFNAGKADILKGKNKTKTKFQNMPKIFNNRNDQTIISSDINVSRNSRKQNTNGTQQKISPTDNKSQIYNNAHEQLDSATVNNNCDDTQIHFKKNKHHDFEQMNATLWMNNSFKPMADLHNKSIASKNNKIYENNNCTMKTDYIPRNDIHEKLNEKPNRDKAQNIKPNVTLVYSSGSTNHNQICTKNQLKNKAEKNSKYMLTKDKPKYTGSDTVSNQSNYTSEATTKPSRKKKGTKEIDSKLRFEEQSTPTSVSTDWSNDSSAESDGHVLRKNKRNSNMPNGGTNDKQNNTINPNKVGIDKPKNTKTSLNAASVIESSRNNYTEAGCDEGAPILPDKNKPAKMLNTNTYRPLSDEMRKSMNTMRILGGRQGNHGINTPPYNSCINTNPNNLALMNPNNHMNNYFNSNYLNHKVQTKQMSSDTHLENKTDTRPENKNRNTLFNENNTSNKYEGNMNSFGYMNDIRFINCNPMQQFNGFNPYIAMTPAHVLYDGGSAPTPQSTFVRPGFYLLPNEANIVPNYDKPNCEKPPHEKRVNHERHNNNNEGGKPTLEHKASMDTNAYTPYHNRYGLLDLAAASIEDFWKLSQDCYED